MRLGLASQVPILSEYRLTSLNGFSDRNLKAQQWCSSKCQWFAAHVSQVLETTRLGPKRGSLLQSCRQQDRTVEPPENPGQANTCAETFLCTPTPETSPRACLDESCSGGLIDGPSSDERAHALEFL